MRNLVGGTVLVITIAMNSAAFISEVIRGGLLAVDKGQREAALSIGLSPVSAYKEVILPQAVCSSISVIGKFIYFHDKKYCDRIYDRGCRYTCTGQILAASSLNFFEAYISVGVVYWVVLVVIDRLLRYMESKICKYL